MKTLFICLGSLFSSALMAVSFDAEQVANSYLESLSNLQTNKAKQIYNIVKGLEQNSGDHREKLCRSYFEAETLRLQAEGMSLFSRYPGPGSEAEAFISNDLLKEYKSNLVNAEYNFKMGLHPVRYFCEDLLSPNNMVSGQQERAMSFLKEFGKSLKVDRTLREQILQKLEKSLPKK